MNDAKDLTGQAIRALKAGRKEEAYRLFSEVVDLDPTNEDALLGKAGCSSDLDETILLLQKILAINPSNERAREGLEWAIERRRTVSETSEVVVAEHEERSSPQALDGVRKEIDKGGKMKKALIIGGVCAGLLLACIIGMAFTSPRAQTPTARTVEGEAPEDTAYFTCWLDSVAGPWDNVADSMEALNKVKTEGDIGATKAQVLLLESDLQVAKAALLACPSPRHRLVVSSREKSLRALDLAVLACQYAVEGISTLDTSLIVKGIGYMVEAENLFQEATSDIQRYNAEVLGK